MERELIEEWFELYERDVTSFLIYYTGSMDVQDLVQETFLRGMKRIAHFREGAHPKTWLITIAKNIVVDRARKKHIWNRIKYFLREEKYTEALDHTILYGEMNQALYEAISNLPAKNKEVVILKAILEMSSKQVAEILESNENHVNVLYHRSLKKLKSILETEGFEYEARTR